MRPAHALGAFALVLALLALPSPATLSRNASASHLAGVVCGVGDLPVADGIISPGEYGDSYFDPTTKILAYVHCDNSTQRLLHVGLVSPWEGWTGLLVQARDPPDGTYQEFRISRDASSAVEAVDGFRNALGVFHPDAELGGTSDIASADGRPTGLTQVYEFSVPLLSSDGYDCQLNGTGPVSFILEYGLESDLGSEPARESDPRLVTLGGVDAPGMMTSVELSLASPSTAAEPSTLLVTLRDGVGYPVSGVELDVFVRTKFGFLDLGPVFANDQGVAEATYTSFDQGTFLVGAAYEGGGGRFASVAWRDLEFGTAAGGGTQVRLGLTDGGSALELEPILAVVVTVVAGVWATYAYATFLVRQALRAGEARGAVRETRVARWKVWR